MRWKDSPPSSGAESRAAVKEISAETPAVSATGRVVDPLSVRRPARRSALRRRRPAWQALVGDLPYGDDDSTIGVTGSRAGRLGRRLSPVERPWT
jgi:hypothetical protein